MKRTPYPVDDDRPRHELPGALRSIMSKLTPPPPPAPDERTVEERQIEEQRL